MDQWAKYDQRVERETAALLTRYTARSNLADACANIDRLNLRQVDLRVEISEIRSRPPPSGLFGWLDVKGKDRDLEEKEAQLARACKVRRGHVHVAWPCPRGLAMSTRLGHVRLSCAHAPAHVASSSSIVMALLTWRC